MNLEIRKLFIQSFAALAAGIPLFVVSMLDKSQVSAGLNQVIWIVVGIIVFVLMWFSGSHFFTGAWTSFKAHNANMNTLVALATGPAWLYSFIVSLMPNLFPPLARHVYYDAPMTVIGLLVLGAALELNISEKASNDIGQHLPVEKDALKQVLEQVKQAQSSKPTIGKIADKISAILAPLVLIISLITMGIWMNFGPIPQIAYMLVTFMAVLLIACPCALGLAAPISISMGIGKAIQNGILFHESDAFSDLRKITTILINFPLSDYEEIQSKTKIELIPTYEWDQDELMKKIHEFHESKHPFALVSDESEKPEILKQASVSIVCSEQAYQVDSDISIFSKSANCLLNTLIISKATLRNIHQNLLGAFVYNGIAIPLAAGILYPLTHTLLSPILAGAMMGASSLLVITNANRLRFLKLKPLPKL